MGDPGSSWSFSGELLNRDRKLLALILVRSFEIPANLAFFVHNHEMRAVNEQVDRSDFIRGFVEHRKLQSVHGERVNIALDTSQEQPA